MSKCIICQKEKSSVNADGFCKQCDEGTQVVHQGYGEKAEAADKAIYEQLSLYTEKGIFRVSVLSNDEMPSQLNDLFGIRFDSDPCEFCEVIKIEYPYVTIHPNEVGIERIEYRWAYYLHTLSEKVAASHTQMFLNNL